jgi:hypothetical protein
MNTMTNTAEFTNRTSPAGANAFFPALGKKLLGLLCMISGTNSIEPSLLADRIVLE